MLFVTGVLALAIWDGPDLRSMLIFMGMAFTAQVSLRMRYRQSVKCPHCGFDPILYKVAPEEAAQLVKAHLEQRRDNPEYLLRPRPKIKPLYLSKEQIKALKKAEDQISLAEATNPSGRDALSLPPESKDFDSSLET